MDTIPREYICPITAEIMTDPVIGTDGHTYERSAITEWLTTRQTHSPITRAPMTVGDLKPNFALRASIERWLSTHTPAPSQPIDIANKSPEEKSFTVTVRDQDEFVALTVTPSSTTPMETICIAVLDVSGSMDGRSQSAQTEQEGPEFSRLDLVKHSMKTLATLMNKQYQITPSSLGIVTFSCSASLAMPITPMTDHGLSYASSTIDSLRADGGTNIWDGLRLALEQAARLPNHVNVQILLLTDGEPTRSYLPILGIERTLTKKLASIPVRTSIHTFGFGYSLDSQLMESIAMIGGGSFGFIPDCSMVGTVFINWCARALLTLAHHVSVKLGESVIPIGDCILGTSHTIVLPKSSLSDESAVVSYDQGQTIPTKLVPNSDSMIHEWFLYKLQTVVKQIKEAPSYVVAKLVAEERLGELFAEIDAIPGKDEFLVDIQRDIRSTDANEGQLMKTVEKEAWYKSWGKPHLIAYHRALVCKQCINFKDKVLQHFAGPEFKTLQEDGITIFSDISPPKPSIDHRKWFGDRMSATLDNMPPFDFSTFVNPNGGCFSGSCVVLMDDGRPKYVKDLKRGDTVWGGHTIRAVVYTALDNPVPMVKFSTGLLITPWHPIRNSPVEPWQFPAEMVKGVQGIFDIKAYYNLVLDSGHVVEINGYQVCTLGHGFTDNEVIHHPYFGTEAVIEDLKMRDGWAEGIVQLSSTNVQRDFYTRLVTKI